MDETEKIRRELVNKIANQITSNNKDHERERLEEANGQVWNTDELSRDFLVLGFMAPYVVVKDKATGRKGSLMFQHYPRYYWGWMEDKQ